MKIFADNILLYPNHKVLFHKESFNASILLNAKYFFGPTDQVTVGLLTRAEHYLTER